MSNLLDLLDLEYDTPYLWDDMPEFVQEIKNPYVEITVNLKTHEDLDAFAKLVDQQAINVPPEVRRFKKSIWHPVLDRYEDSNYRWMEENE